MFSSQASTRGVQVTVQAEYVPERSDPHNQRWFFTYHVRISNRGDTKVQLVSRHWIITDANGRVEEVKGPGVVGEQPVLKPGQSFEYTSLCPLNTPFGTMEGSYQMVTEDGDAFDAAINQFSLSQPMPVN